MFTPATRFMLLALVAIIVPACAGGTSDDRFNPPPAPIPFPAVLFLADALVDGEQQLFATDLTGSSIVDLSGPLVATGSVINFFWSPDREWVAFLAEKDAVGVRELFVVPAAGGTPVKVSRPLVAGGNVSFAAWAPDGSRIAYIADAITDDVFELFTTFPNGAGATAKLNPTPVANGDVINFAWAPDSSRIAYRADQDIDTVDEIYTSTPDGPSDNQKVNPAFPAGRAAASLLRWSPDSSLIAYIADQDTDNIFELYASAPDGTGNVKLNGPLAGSTVIATANWLPDGSRVVYVADQDLPGQFELYSSLPDGTGNVKLNPAFTPGARTVSAFAIAPNGSRVLYQANQDTVGIVDVYTSLPAGGGNVKITGTLISSVQGAAVWSPNSSRIAYVAPQDTAGVSELYTSLAAGGGNVKLSGAMVAGGNVSDTTVQFSPDSSRVSYIADQDTDTVFELYTSAAGGGGNVKINGPLVAGGGISNFPPPSWSSNNAALVSIADVAVDNFLELFASPAAGPADSVRISGPMVAFGAGVTAFQVR